LFALFGLISLTIKIVFLAIAYASLTLLFLYTISKTINPKWSRIITENKFLVWIATGFIYTFSLYIYAFSFWGYSGLGDYACIPVSNGFKVKSIDALDNSWFEPDKGESSKQADLLKFSIKNQVICGEFTGYNSTRCSGCIIAFDTKTEKVYEFHSSEGYSKFAAENDLPQLDEFKTFGENYSEYWNGRRSFFLP
jgi:hypothetical protein